MHITFDQMGKKSIITQKKIADTATKMFLEKGFDGVKMQELADRAGVNKGLLHHYFKNKQSLFDEVFANAFNQLFGKIESSLVIDGSLEDKTNLIIDVYFDMLISNPKLPIFVFFELNKDPGLFDKLFSIDRIAILINGIKKGNSNLNDQSAIHIILTIVSLSVFPFMARPIVLKMIKNEENFSRLIEKRRPMVKLLVSNLVKSL